jgi:hypothetical protein
MYRKITNNSNIETLKINLDRLGEWAVQYTMNMNPGKSTARVKGPVNYFGGPKISGSKPQKIFRNNLTERFNPYPANVKNRVSS